MYYHIVAPIYFNFHAFSSDFVSLYMKKVASAFDAKFSNQASSKDESFRCTLTLHVLLENPPSDYPDIMREEVLNGFSAIFLHIRQVLWPMFLCRFQIP
jgi:hypothetical protein